VAAGNPIGEFFPGVSYVGHLRLPLMEPSISRLNRGLQQLLDAVLVDSARAEDLTDVVHRLAEFARHMYRAILELNRAQLFIVRLLIKWVRPEESSFVRVVVDHGVERVGSTGPWPAEHRGERSAALVKRSIAILGEQNLSLALRLHLVGQCAGDIRVGGFNHGYPKLRWIFGNHRSAGQQ